MSSMDALLGLPLDEVAKKLSEEENRMSAANTKNSGVSLNKEKQPAGQVPVDTEKIMDMTLDAYAAVLRQRKHSGPSDKKTNVLANKMTKTVMKTLLKDQTLDECFQNYKRADLAGVHKRTYALGTQRMQQNSVPKQQFLPRAPRNTLSFQKQPDARHLLMQQRRTFVPQPRPSNIVFKTFDKQRFNSHQVAPVRKQFVLQQQVINPAYSEQWVPMQREQQPQRQTFQSQLQPQHHVQQRDFPEPAIRFVTRTQQQQQQQQQQHAHQQHHQQHHYQPSYHFVEQQQHAVPRYVQQPEHPIRYVQQPEPAVRYVQQPEQTLQQQTATRQVQQPAARQVPQPERQVPQHARQAQQRFSTNDGPRWDVDNEPSRTSNSLRIVNYRRDVDARQGDSRQNGSVQEPPRAITTKPAVAYPTVKVSNIPLEYTRLDILGAFKDHFDVHDVIMKHRGTAFVLFLNIADARRAIEQFDGGEMNDYKIKVAWTDNIVV